MQQDLRNVLHTHGKVINLEQSLYNYAINVSFNKFLTK